MLEQQAVSPASTTASDHSSAEKVLTEVLDLKQKGNDFHKTSLFGEAIDQYGLAIKLVEGFCPSEDPVVIEMTSTHLPLILCNRSLCHVKLENFGAAVTDAARAIQLARTKATRSKALFRRGSAYACLTKYDAAVRDFKNALQLTPSDGTIERRLKEAQALWQHQKFAEAIKADERVPVSQTIDLSSYEIEADYKGPIYEGEQSWTPEFFEKVLLYFRSNHQNRLHRKCILMLALDMIKHLKDQPNIVRIDVPDRPDELLTVCGDVHGQFYDLLSIFSKNGLPSCKNRYLFNGDFVDRGSFSVEVICTFYLAKLVWPNAFFLTRGNHESRRMTKLYGFEGEMRAKASTLIYEVYCESFDHLPLAHCLNNRVFVVHGGLSSRKGVTLQEIDELDRHRDEDDAGLMTDLLWADPQPQEGCSPSKRGVSNNFGPDITEDFLAINDLEMVIRSHEMKDAGYEIAHNGKLYTVFSAPNYCDQMGNRGAFLRFTGSSLNNKSEELRPEIQVFDHVAHPPIRAMSYANPVFMG